MTDQKHKKADIFSVARAAGVSISTVSRAFNHPEQVKPSTRKRVERAVRRLGYIRNRAAQTIHGIRSATIGLVVPTVDHAIFGELIQSFSDSVERKGFTILLGSHGYDLGREYRIVRKFFEHRVDGVALIGLDHAEDTFRLIAEQGVPATTLWNWSKDSPLPCIGMDNRAAGALAAEHLIALGHRRIALAFPPPEGNDRAAGRLAGALERLARAGLEVPPHWVISTRYAIGEARDSVSSLLDCAAPPTAILCGNDIIAQGAVYALMRAGLVPARDLSVIGIGDFKGSAHMEPALTTIRLPAKRIGRIAGAAMTDAFDEGAGPIRSRRCGIRLMMRSTCAPPPGGGGAPPG